jgi:hypothetical protein
MYRCEICGAISEPRQPKLRHVTHTKTGDIKREIAVCPSCKGKLELGENAGSIETAEPPQAAEPVAPPKFLPEGPARKRV